MTFVIAIDGPAASGKGTLARKLAEKYNFHHLDTGLLYRATAARLLALGSRLDDEARAARVAAELDLNTLDRTTLSDHTVGEAASKVANMPEVRAALFELQQHFSKQEPGAVLDGRDIATVICPDAELKLFITASLEARAMRRFREIESKGNIATYENILADIQRRDARDQNRSVAPLTVTADTHLIDTTKMDIETAFQTACDYVEQSL